MKGITSVLALTICMLTFGVSVPSGQSTSKAKLRYPNELPSLKIYEKAKWNSLKPYVSTVDDVEELLGKPVPLLDERFHGEFGFADDPDWTVVIHVVGDAGRAPKSVAGRVFDINLYPKGRVSLTGADLSAFRRSGTFSQGEEETTTYNDKFGLWYMVHAKDSNDKRFHEGDLERIVYGPPIETTLEFPGRNCLIGQLACRSRMALSYKL